MNPNTITVQDVHALLDLVQSEYKEIRDRAKEMMEDDIEWLLR